jgi:glycosyltransferase involved in cell wall biosynthesis
MRIAVVGGRGIPARYSGFETFAEELCPRLVEMGHEVTVYGRKGYDQETVDEYKGVRVVWPPYVRKQALERISAEFMTILHSMRNPVDLYYLLAVDSAWMYTPLRATKRIIVCNTDGLGWKRRKWNAAGRVYLRFAEWAAARFAADHLVSDARSIRQYFLDTYKRDSVYLTNGANVLSELPPGALDEWDLEPRSYYLVACRVEPENNTDIIIKEFIASGAERKHELIIAGGIMYESEHWKDLQRLAEGHRVRFLGPQYKPGKVEALHLGCYGYIHGHEVGGTNPALLKAMGCANLVMALRNPFNEENLADGGLYWEKTPGSLARLFRWTETHEDEARKLGKSAQRRIAEHYSWDGIARAHDEYFRELGRRRGLPV